MKWRCTWCGKPHESDDPPCDACGHGEFEKAVVREREFETVDTGTQYVWVCASCGCQHVKNNPPCSRCGDHDLRKVKQEYQDVESELSAPSWFEVARPYLPAFALLALVVALFATGIVPLSALVPGDGGAPTPPEAPGEADSAAGIEFATVERAVHNRLEDAREDRGVESREYDEGVAGIAEYRSRQAVIEGSGEDPPEDPDWSAFGADCPSGISLTSLAPGSIEEFDDESALADTITETLVEERSEAVLSAGSSEGLDLHAAPGAAVLVTYASC